MGTNLRIRDPKVAAELEALLAPGLKQNGAVNEFADPGLYILGVEQLNLDSAIKQSRHKAAIELSACIAALNPTAFEWLFRSLLAELGYTNIEVTKPSNDGGVDLRATLFAGGIANLKTAVQVKRTNSVGRSVVQALRGSLSAHESGLLVTSGLFTDGAKEEASEPTRAAIA